ncbi:MAG: polyphenol oxidase family protein [Sumerlaeia bacterium]
MSPPAESPSLPLSTRPRPCGAGRARVAVLGRDAGIEKGRPLAPQLAAALAPACPKHIALLKQVHGTALHDAANALAAGEKLLEGDGLVTREAGAAVCVRTADCVPLILTSTKAPFLAAIHSGWRGTLAAILPRAIALAGAAGHSPSDLHLWIGPCIRGDVYEVSEDLAAEFTARFGADSGVVRGRLLNLARANRLWAERGGLPANQVEDCGLCTYKDHRSWPSFRRDGATGESIYTVAWIERQAFASGLDRTRRIGG